MPWFGVIPICAATSSTIGMTQYTDIFKLIQTKGLIILSNRIHRPVSVRQYAIFAIVCKLLDLDQNTIKIIWSKIKPARNEKGRCFRVFCPAQNFPYKVNLQYAGKPKFYLAPLLFPREKGSLCLVDYLPSPLKLSHPP